MLDIYLQVPESLGTHQKPYTSSVPFQSLGIAAFSELTAAANLPSLVSVHLLSHHPTETLLTVSVDA